MMINVLVGDKRSSFSLTKINKVILNRTVELLLAEHNKFNLIKWLISIALDTLNKKELKTIRDELRQYTKGRLNELNSFSQSNFVNTSFKDYESILINRLKKVFKKAGININSLPENNIKPFILRTLKLLESSVAHGSVVLSLPAKHPIITTHKKLSLEPFAYKVDEKPLRGLFIKKGLMKWHSVFLFNPKKIVIIEVINNKPLIIDFKSTWLKIYDLINNKSSDEVFYIITNEFIKALSNAKEVKMNNYIDLTKYEVPNYTIIGSYEDKLFLLRNDIKISDVGVESRRIIKRVEILFLSEDNKVKKIVLSKGKIRGLESYDRAPKGNIKLVIDEESINRLSEKQEWFKNKKKITLMTSADIKKDGIFVFSKDNCKQLSDNEFIIAFITKSGKKLIVRNPIEGVTFFKNKFNKPIKVMKKPENFKDLSSIRELLKINQKNRFLLIGDELIKA